MRFLEVGRRVLVIVATYALDLVAVRALNPTLAGKQNLVPSALLRHEESGILVEPNVEDARPGFSPCEGERIPSLPHEDVRLLRSADERGANSPGIFLAPNVIQASFHGLLVCRALVGARPLAA